MDIMHDILKVCCNMRWRRCLNFFKSRRILSLEDINNAIDTFPYRYADAADKPSPISDTTLDSTETNSLKQKGAWIQLCDIVLCIYMPCHAAAQMWCLARYLPMMIGKKIPALQPNWLNFLLLLTIVDYVFSPTSSNDIVAYLYQLINEHHTTFFQLYPTCSITPKFHYMIHIPEWISRFVLWIPCCLYDILWHDLCVTYTGVVPSVATGVWGLRQSTTILSV